MDLIIKDDLITPLIAFGSIGFGCMIISLIGIYLRNRKASITSSQGGKLE